VFGTCEVAGFGLAAILGERFTRPLGCHFSRDLFSRALLPRVLFVANWSAAPVPTPLDVLWSVSIEEQFYIVFPCLFVNSTRRLPPLPPILLGLLVALSVRAWLAWRGPGPISILRNTFAHSDHLLLGTLLAQLTHVADARTSARFRTFLSRFEVPVLVALFVLTGYGRSRVASVPGFDSLT
jgi:peptidoglycan/LPS O-acetylase OafA/YrhL